MRESRLRKKILYLVEIKPYFIPMTKKGDIVKSKIVASSSITNRGVLWDLFYGTYMDIPIQYGSPGNSTSIYYDNKTRYSRVNDSKDVLISDIISTRSYKITKLDGFIEDPEFSESHGSVADLGMAPDKPVKKKRKIKSVSEEILDCYLYYCGD